MLGSTLAHLAVELGAKVRIVDALLPLYGGNSKRSGMLITFSIWLLRSVMFTAIETRCSTSISIAVGTSSSSRPAGSIVRKRKSFFLVQDLFTDPHNTIRLTKIIRPIARASMASINSTLRNTSASIVRHITSTRRASVLQTLTALASR